MTECKKCGRQLFLDEICWIRITDTHGGKIAGKPVCENCARKIAAKLKDE